MLFGSSTNADVSNGIGFSIELFICDFSYSESSVSKVTAEIDSVAFFDGGQNSHLIEHLQRH